MNRKRFFILLFLSVGLIWFLKSKTPEVHDTHEAPLTLETPNPFAPTITPSPSEVDSKTSAQTAPKKRKLKPLETSAPKLETLREEIAKNPHGMPPSLEKFAADLGEKMQYALRSESAAQKVFPELANCALDIPQSTFASTPRTLCYNDASRLAQKYPSLQESFIKVKQELDPETLKRFHQFEKVLQDP